MPKRKALSPSPSLDPADPCAIGQFWLTQDEVNRIREKMNKIKLGKTWRWEWRVEEVSKAQGARSKKRTKEKETEAKQAKASEVQARQAAKAQATPKAAPKAALKSRPTAKAKPKAAPKASPNSTASRNRRDAQAAQEMVPAPQAQTIEEDDQQSDTDIRNEETRGGGGHVTPVVNEFVETLWFSYGLQPSHQKAPCGKAFCGNLGGVLVWTCPVCAPDGFAVVTVRPARTRFSSRLGRTNLRGPCGGLSPRVPQSLILCRMYWLDVIGYIGHL